MKFVNRKEWDQFIALLTEFNAKVKEISADNGFWKPANGPVASKDLIYHCLDMTYSRIVSPCVNQLRDYQQFSNNVYGGNVSC